MKTVPGGLRIYLVACLAGSVLCGIGAAPVSAQIGDLTEYDYEHLRFRGVGLEGGYIFPSTVENGTAWFDNFTFLRMHSLDAAQEIAEMGEIGLLFQDTRLETQAQEWAVQGGYDWLAAQRALEEWPSRKIFCRDSKKLPQI